MDNSQIILFAVMVFCVLIFIVFFVVAISYFRTWFKCFMSGCPVSIFDLIGMTFRRSPAALITDAYIALHQRGEPVSLSTIESCYLAYAPQIRDVGALLEKLREYEDNLKKHTGSRH